MNLKPLAESTIGFIGGGNMARAIIAGLIRQGHPAPQIHVANPGAAKRAQLAQEFGIRTDADNALVATQADILLLAVKPQKMQEALSSLSPGVVKDKLIISVAAGFPIDKLKALLGENNYFVRSMPNTPALAGEGATGLYTEQTTPGDMKALASEIFAAVGLSEWVESEAQIDLVTAIAGSSPAYFFLMAEAMTTKATELGMSAESAQKLILQAMKGAAMLAQDESESLALLRKRVTSPGGTTQAALEYLFDHEFESIIAGAVEAAFYRGQQLAKVDND